VSIQATVDFKPDVLNLRSKGKWVTVYIELPDGYDVSEINASSIRLNEKISAEPCPVEVGDYDRDGVKDLMVKFDREKVKSILKTGMQTITITGIVAGTPFHGSDEVLVIANLRQNFPLLFLQPSLFPQILKQLKIRKRAFLRLGEAY